MRKQALALVLLLTLSVQYFHKAFVVGAFYWNQTEIAKTLCENKDKPKLKCGGKCQLMKKMQQEEKKEQQLPNLKWDGKELVLSSKSFFATLMPYVPVSDPIYSSYYAAALNDYSTAIFHPPGLG